MNILEEAKELVYGDREEVYGHPNENFMRTALLWTAHLRGNGLLKDHALVRSKDVAWMMLQVKQAREMTMHKRDNLVDAAGYIATAARVHGDDEQGDSE